METTTTTASSKKAKAGGGGAAQKSAGSAAADDMVEGPKQASIIATILKSMGVEEYEPRVVIQLLEFMQRYVSDVLEDASVYSEHAGRNKIDIDDVRLAIQARVNFSFTGPPPREFMMELAGRRNMVPLPSIPQKMGVRLPPERYCLSAVNYQIDSEPLPTPAPPESLATDTTEKQRTSMPIIKPREPPGIQHTKPNLVIKPMLKKNDDDDYDLDTKTDS